MDEKLIYRYSLRESETGEEMTENLRFVFVELGTFRKSESELRGMLDKWMYVLKEPIREEYDDGKRQKECSGLCTTGRTGGR